jgi:trehalose 6-phosphate phosphatase
MKIMRSNNKIIPISSELFRAGIFDLDGVVTQTAKVHAAAWKALFDEYLHQRSANCGEEFRPFDIDSDYRLYVDGKPRYEGAKCFLESRGITLPLGKSKDPVDSRTICGLGNKKDFYFKKLLRDGSVQVYESSIHLIRNLRLRNMRTAIVSSSKNCQEILEAAGITELFDAKIDGTDSERLNLTGKPAPDAFLEAARQIGVEPEYAIVFEDALAGVEAGRRGGFGFVIGVDRTGKPDALFNSGAHAVVSDLSQVVVMDGVMAASTADLPSALQRIEEIKSLIQKHRLAVFLDYDGTLTPIVNRPEDAVLSEQMKYTLRQLAERCIVAIISGRDLRDVRDRVGIGKIIYAGSHGFEIAGPSGSLFELGVDHIPVLDKVEKELHSSLGKISGVLVERKRFSIAIHYRLSKDEDRKIVKEIAIRTAALWPELRLSRGKMVIDFQPAIDWNKGKAVGRLLEQVSCSPKDTIPLYAGDDTTDEDAFRAIRYSGIGIVISSESRPTAARYALENTDEVQQFLEILASSVLSEVIW